MKRVEEPGIFAMMADDYHADPAPQPSLSNSLMHILLTRTPQHARLAHPRLNPNRVAKADADKFDIGSAAHALLLEGHDHAVVVDADEWRTKSAQDLRDLARKAGKLALLKRQHEAVLAMMSAAHQYVDSTALRGILNRGKPERTLVWKENSIWCRARLDWLTDDRSIILDYKTTGVEGPGEFMRRNMIANGYDTQAVWYPRGVKALGHPAPRFLFLVQEVTSPFLCYLVEPAESMVELATHKVARALPLWRDCLTSNRWPGYPVEVHQADAPIWALREEEAAA